MCATNVWPDKHIVGDNTVEFGRFGRLGKANFNKFACGIYFER